MVQQMIAVKTKSIDHPGFEPVTFGSHALPIEQ